MDSMESFKRVVRPVKGALHTITSDAGFRVAMQHDAARWDIHSDLGVSLRAMRELGHWRPVPRSHQLRAAFAVCAGIKPDGPRWSRRPDTMDQIARLAEEIHSNSSDHDVKQWAWEILVLASPSTGDSDVTPRNW